MLHETALKAEFENLEEEKYRLDRQLLQAIEELRESKNTLLKSEAETAVLSRKIEVLLSESNDAKEELAKLKEDAVIR
jgi:chaperonin cofactor prefoldin